MLCKFLICWLAWSVFIVAVRAPTIGEGKSSARLTLFGSQVLRRLYDNRRCVNPDHLDLGSRGENLQDERDFYADGVDFGLL